MSPRAELPATPALSAARSEHLNQYVIAAILRESGVHHRGFSMERQVNLKMHRTVLVQCIGIVKDLSDNESRLLVRRHLPAKNGDWRKRASYVPY